jgi:hypothetical protein
MSRNSEAENGSNDKADEIDDYWRVHVFFTHK